MFSCACYVTDACPSLQHVNIVKFHGFWTDPERARMVFITEYMTSGSLKQFLKKSRKNKFKSLTEKVLKRWCRQILSALRCEPESGFMLSLHSSTHYTTAGFNTLYHSRVQHIIPQQGSTHYTAAGFNTLYHSRVQHCNQHAAFVLEKCIEKWRPAVKMCTVEPPVSGHPRDLVEVSAYGRLHITMQNNGT